MENIDRLFIANQIRKYTEIEQKQILITLEEVITISLLIQYEGFSKVHEYLSQTNAPEWKIEIIDLMKKGMGLELTKECLALDLYRQDLNSIDALCAYIYSKTVMFFAHDYCIEILPDYLLHHLPASLRRKAKAQISVQINHYKSERKKQLLDNYLSTADFPIASDSPALQVIREELTASSDDELTNIVTILARKDLSILLSYLPKSLASRIISIITLDMETLEELGFYTEDEIEKTVAAIHYIRSFHS